MKGSFSKIGTRYSSVVNHGSEPFRSITSAGVAFYVKETLNLPKTL
jgi:hypothetical protein